MMRTAPMLAWSGLDVMGVMARSRRGASVSLLGQVSRLRGGLLSRWDRTRTSLRTEAHACECASLKWPHLKPE
jgi:hypothetical protein